MAFQAKQYARLNPAFLVRRILANSTTFNVGEVVESMTTGYAKHVAKTTALLGVIVGFEDSNNSPLQPSTPTKSTTAYNGSVEQVVAASDNQTVSKYQAVVCCDPTVVWSAQVDGTIGTTNSSDLPACGIDVDSDNTNYDRVLETTATRTASTLTGFYSLGKDPDDATRLLVTISASEQFSSKRG